MRQAAYDVVVVGCGIAGTAAAAAARQGGASVAVLERAPEAERGGNTRYTQAFMLMKSHDAVQDSFVPRLIECAGGLLDPGLVALTARPYGEWPPTLRSLAFADPEVVEVFADEAGPTIRWMETFGVRFDMVPTPHGVAGEYLTPQGGGLALVDKLAEWAARAGVAFHYETTARALRTGDDGAIAGVRATVRGGEPVEVSAPVVILASGGFEGSPEMLTRYLGPRAIYMKPYGPGGYWNRGECIEMALGLGAAPAGEYASYHAQAVDPRSRRIGENAMYGIQYGVLVNREGERFVDEAGGNLDLPAGSVTRTIRVRLEALTRAIPDQHGGVAYLVLDAKVDDLPNREAIFNTDAPPVVADTLAGLAIELGVDPAGLEATVREFNAACPAADGFAPLRPDGLATRGLRIPKSHWSRPVDRAPFRAYPIASSNVFTFGGLKVDRHARVLSTDGDPIRGLYAAGETVGIYYRDYLGATSVLRGAVFGRLAGAHAAAGLRA